MKLLHKPAPQAEPEAEPGPPQPPTSEDVKAESEAPAYATPMVTPLDTVKFPRAQLGTKKKGPVKKRGMTEFQRTSFRIFGKVFTSRSIDVKLEEALRKARTGVRPEALQSTALLVGIISAMSTAMATVFLLGVMLPALHVRLAVTMLLLFGLAPFIAGAAGYAGVVASPRARAKARGKDIDLRLPYALNYIAAMASAGVNVDTIFKSLGEQRIYGEVAAEAEAIYRDIHLFGKDTVTAFKRAIARTPSQRFAELLQGAITTFSSGGDLQLYFAAKAQRYMMENRQEQKMFVDTMGLMAETYVTSAVAGPLFLMVMMSIMSMLGGQGPGQLYLIVYL
ncbi:MAG: type II secretion system F family protein, partial [Halobacteriales archaeon]|nr:type II secretion system F family protein [Halobacteriales archaeon]